MTILLHKVTDEEGTATDKETIMEKVKGFYQKLYKKRNLCNNYAEFLYIQVHNIHHITSTSLFLPVEHRSCNRNRAKYHLSCVQRFRNKFGGTEGATPYKTLAPLVF